MCKSAGKKIGRVWNRGQGINWVVSGLKDQRGLICAKLAPWRFGIDRMIPGDMGVFRYRSSHRLPILATKRAE